MCNLEKNTDIAISLSKYRVPTQPNILSDSLSSL